jgi:hypothetical protein
MASQKVLRFDSVCTDACAAGRLEDGHDRLVDDQPTTLPAAAALAVLHIVIMMMMMVVMMMMMMVVVVVVMIVHTVQCTARRRG